MIVRIWHGWTTPELADEYEGLLRREIIPGIRAKDVPGFLSIQLMRHEPGSGETEVEFVTIMTFASWDAVRTFAGDDPERAYVPESARRVLSRFDDRSRHYEIRDVAAPADEGAERVTGIGGVFFKADDPKALSAWYREHLGLRVTGGAPEMPAFEWREKDAPERIARTVWALFDRGTRYFDPGRAPFMINYRVRDLDRLVGRLREAGIDVKGIEDAFNGRFAWITDPEGNRVELWQPVEGW
jgi:catechol 2,3-dioxygenase-like lactoylglutathione lyase family enzyme